MPSGLVVVVEILSTLATLTLVFSTLKPCRESGISYLLGVPAGFGLLTIAFATNAFLNITQLVLPASGLILGVVFLLTQTYGLIFLGLTYARKTRLKFIGESVSVELAIPTAVTIAVLAYSLTYDRSGSVNAVPLSVSLPLRAVMALAAFYIVYETGRNWGLTRRASEGFVTVGFLLLLVEQIGFMLAEGNFGDVAIFLGYEGRIVGLFVLVAVTFVGIKKGDFTNLLKRLGLEAPAH
jgi:hypothetical protein